MATQIGQQRYLRQIQTADAQSVWVESRASTLYSSVVYRRDFVLILLDQLFVYLPQYLRGSILHSHIDIYFLIYVHMCFCTVYT